MKITKETLKEIIKEEIGKMLKENPMMGTPDYAATPPDLSPAGEEGATSTIDLARQAHVAISALLSHLEEA